MTPPEKYKSYFNKNRPFFAEYGSGTGSITILIKKNLPTYLYRLLRFRELGRYVVDGRGSVLVYNKIEELSKILDYKEKVHAKYKLDDNLARREWHTGEYNHAWFGGLYGGKPTTEEKLIKDPYHFWVYGYKAHFFLERPTEKRNYYAYWREEK